MYMYTFDAVLAIAYEKSQKEMRPGMILSPFEEYVKLLLADMYGLDFIISTGSSLMNS